MPSPEISRRKFLRTAAGAATLSSLAPASALGANDRIRMGVIGVGGQGSGHLGSLVKRSQEDNIQVVAVCDVYQRRLSRAKAACNGEGYLDYRKLLERQDIDAVLIATPDHWHAKIAMDAMESGKHVYTEKPMTHTVEQAIELRNAVRYHKKVLQVGPQATGDDGYRQVRQAIAAGRTGKPTLAQGSYNRNARICLFNNNQKVDPTASPSSIGDDYIDWDMWLGWKWGLAPKIPWTPDHFFRFRKYWPYNGGVATDLLYHKLAPMLRALVGPNGEYPLRVNASGGLYIEKDGRDIPDVFLLTADYPSEFSIVLISILTNDSEIQDRIYAKHATIELGGDPVLEANGDFEAEFKARNDGKTKVTLPRTPRRDMEGNFLDAIRGKDELHCNVELGASTMVAIKMGVESYRQRKTMLWDAQKEKVVSRSALRDQSPVRYTFPDRTKKRE